MHKSGECCGCVSWVGTSWKACLGLMEEMRRRDILPNEITFTTVMSCQERAGNWEGALATVAAMRKQGISCVRLGSVAQARSLDLQISAFQLQVLENSKGDEQPLSPRGGAFDDPSGAGDCSHTAGFAIAQGVTGYHNRFLKECLGSKDCQDAKRKPRIALALRSAASVDSFARREAESDFLSLRLIEASVDWQETLIEEACSEEDETRIPRLVVGETCVEADPYGMAVWPAAQVLAQAAAAYGLRAQGALELGCGCGLASLALLSLDMEESAERLGVAEHLETQLLDLRDHGHPLPKADLVLASDVLYEKQTAEAMAQRVVEARQQNCAVLISDIGRPNRKVFIEKLAGLRPEESSEFASSGIAVQRVGGTEAGRTKVELLELPANGPASVLVIPSEGQAMPGFVRVAYMIAPKLRDCTADAEDLAIMALAEADQRQLALALCPRLTQGPATTAEEFLEMLQCRTDTNLFRKVLPELNFAMKDEVWDVRRSAVHLLSELGPFFVDITTETLKQLHPCSDEVVQLMVAFVLKNVEGAFCFGQVMHIGLLELRPSSSFVRRTFTTNTSENV
ncbi:unnamed protein product [Symbiodinium necroappetens]|uniref:Uncharacterized protein n=1 Tax=Symbiodinium necroappetens TaxID=1628268 RepID=A0A813AKR0_9DINO|nr:unnamed protein product [Symbiodinium necroappetens]